MADEFQSIMNYFMNQELQREHRYVTDFLALIGCTGPDQGFIFVCMPGDNPLLQGGTVRVLGPDGILHHLRVTE